EGQFYKLTRHIWFGFSAGTQKSFDESWPSMSRLPVRLIWLSAEPLIGPLKIGDYLACDHPALTGTDDPDCNRCDGCGALIRDIDDPEGDCTTMGMKTGEIKRFRQEVIERGRLLGWVVAGGESAKRARPMHPDWPRQWRDDCQAAGVPFYFKQWGSW